MSRTTLIVALAFAAFASAVAKVYVVHLNRTSFAELQQLRVQRDEMDIEWGRLQIEQAAWSTHSRIEQIAAQRLSMRMPAPEQVVIVRR